MLWELYIYPSPLVGFQLNIGINTSVIELTAFKKTCLGLNKPVALPANDL